MRLNFLKCIALIALFTFSVPLASNVYGCIRFNCDYSATQDLAMAEGYCGNTSSHQTDDFLRFSDSTPYIPCDDDTVVTSDAFVKRTKRSLAFNFSTIAQDRFSPPYSAAFLPVSYKLVLNSGPSISQTMLAHRTVVLLNWEQPLQKPLVTSHAWFLTLLIKKLKVLDAWSALRGMSHEISLLVLYILCLRTVDIRLYQSNVYAQLLLHWVQKWFQKIGRDFDVTKGGSQQPWWSFYRQYVVRSNKHNFNCWSEMLVWLLADDARLQWRFLPLPSTPVGYSRIIGER